MSTTGQGAFSYPMTANRMSMLDVEKGLWQPVASPLIEERRNVIAGAMNSQEALGQLTLEQYQQWAALDWKEPHASARAVRRFAAKIIEETIDESLLIYEKLVPSKTAAYNSELVDELGDISWIVSGQATNAQQNLMRGVRLRLRDQYVAFRPPHPITLTDVDDLMAEGFQPQPFGSPQLESDGEELWDYDELDPHTNWLLLSGLLMTTTLSGIEESADGQTEYYTPNHRELQNVAALTADSLLFVAYTARRWGGGSLQDVIRHNVQKVSSRVANDQVDKADNPR